MSLTSLLALRFGLAALLLWMLVVASPLLRTAVRETRGRWAGLFLWGFIGLAGQAALFFGALRFITASLAEVLLYTCPAFLALVLWVRARRRPPPAVMASIALALLGTWMVAAPATGAASLSGVLLGLGAGAWFAGFVLALANASAGVHPIVSTTWVVTGSAAAYLCVALLAGGFALPQGPSAWFAVLGMVLTATVCGFTLFVVGLRRTGPQVASVLSTFEPVGTLFL